MLFNALGKEHIRNIVDIQLSRIQKQLSHRRIEIDLTSAAKDYLGDLGYDADFGARPLKRVIQRSIQDPLAQKILKGEIKDGDKVKIDYSAKELSFSVEN